MVIVDYNRAYDIVLRLSQENKEETGFFYVEKSKLINSLRVEPGITRPTRGETHNYSGPLRSFSWDSVLRTLERHEAISIAELSDNNNEIVIPSKEYENVRL